MERKKIIEKEDSELHSEVQEKSINGFSQAGTVMKKKTLGQIDPVYDSVSGFMSTNEKIAYCERLILETEQFLGISTRTLEARSKERYLDIIVAAQIEIDRLKEL